MAFPTPDWPGTTDTPETRVNFVDVVYAADFKWHDDRIISLQEMFGNGVNQAIGEAKPASQGVTGMASPVASGGVALKLAAKNTFSAGDILQVLDNGISGTVKAKLNYAGLLWALAGFDASNGIVIPVGALSTPGTAGRLQWDTGAPGLVFDDGLSWIPVGAGGGGNDSLPNIDHWLIVDVTSGSYTPDGTIQLPFNSVAAAIVAAAALSPTPANPVGIKIMPGVYIETNLDLPSYVHVVGEDRDACILLTTSDNPVIEQTNPHASWRRLTIQRTGSAGTTGGTGDDITADSPVVGTATLDDAGGAFTPTMVGQYILISGATNFQNDGLKLITAVNSPTQIEIDNQWAVTVVGDSFTYTVPNHTRAVVVGVDDWAGNTDFISDVIFEDVVFLPGERYGVIVQGAGSGVGDDITANSPSFGTATLDDAGGAFTDAMVGKRITISGATTPDHNGSFLITAVNSATQLEMTCGTFTSIVGDSFDYAIESDVDFNRCRAFVEYPADGQYFGSFLTMYSSLDVGPRVRLRNCEIHGDIHATKGALELALCDVHDGQVRVTSLFNDVCDTSINISRSKLSLTSFKHTGHEFQDWGALHIHTTGYVLCDLSSFVALGEYDGCGNADSFGVYLATIDPTESPDGLAFMNCHFGYSEDVPSPSAPGDPAIPTYGLATAFGSAGQFVTARFLGCSFALPVEPYVHNEGETVFPVGPGQIYDTSVNAIVGLIGRIGTDYLVVKLFEDLGVGASSSLPSGQWVVFDLNGFTGSGTIISAGSFASNNQQVVVKNGKLDGATLLNVTAGATVVVQGVFEDLEIINGANVQALAGGAGCKLTLRDIRGWVGKSSSWGMRLGSTTFEYELEHVYIKGGGTTEAVQFDNVATSPFSASRCTFIHGSGGANLPLLSAASITQGSAVVTLDFCRMNADPTADANITATPESAFNIIDNNLVDFLG